MELRIIKFVLTPIICLFVLLNGVYTVPQSQQALLLQFGELVKVVKDPGLHFKIPFIQTPFFYDKKILNVIAEEKELIAQDQKRVIISAYAKYRITNPLKFYQTVRSVGGLQSRLNNIFDSSLRLVIGQEPLIALLSEKRTRMMEEIQKLVNQQSRNFGIDVVDVRILRADLPDKNSAAIYQRMQSDREKEAKEIRAQGQEESEVIRSKSDKERTILLAEANKKSQILKGEGDAQATKIYADAYSRDPGFYSFYRSLESYKKVFDKNNTNLFLSTDDQYLKYLEKE
ncbi:MAG: protease modulator HflC [Rickettsiales bacterium]